MSKRASVNAGQALKVAQFFTKRKKGKGDDDTLLTDTMSLISPAGDSNSGLSMFVLTQAEDTEMHLASVRQFAAYIICSMYLAGLDRAYGGVHTEVSRLMTATQDSSRNTVIDFSLVKNMLSTPISSIASFEMGRPHQSVNELELASEIAYVLDAGLSKFLFGKDRKKRSAAAFGEEPFEVRVGATDPNESAHEFAGKSRVTKTPSVHTYLALTLLDPYAYGISEKRAVLTFLVSVMQRAILRNTKPEMFDDRDKKDEIDSEIDSSVVLSSLSASSLVEGDAEEAAAIRAEILKLPTFKKFVRCMREHSADTAHTSNPSFHALYTLLKGTYLVHFSSYYLSMAVNTILRDEMNTEDTPVTAAKDRKCVLSRSVLSSIEGSARELARLADDVHNASGADRLDLHDLRRLISKANVALCELQDRCAYKEEHPAGGTTSMTLYGLIEKRMFKEINGDGLPTPNPPKIAQDLLLKTKDELASILINGQYPVSDHHQTLFPLYTRSSQIFEHDAARDIGEDVTHDDMVQVARFHVALMMYHVHRSTDDFHGGKLDEDTSSPEEKMRRVRFFRLRAIVLFLTRLFAFFFRSYTHLVQPRKEQPVIVTMLVGAGWKRSAQRENEAARLQKMFSSFTRVMSNLLLFCHHIKGDLYRGPILMKQLRKLYFSNLALMAVAQQKLLKTVPSCHPFHSGTKTQLTLPTAIAVKMIPTEFVMPPDYTVAGSNDRTYKDSEEENARKAAVGNARVLTGRKGVGELRAMQAADNVVAYINATSAAGPRETAKEFDAKSLAVGGVAPGLMKIDPAAYMRALSTKN